MIKLIFIILIPVVFQLGLLASSTEVAVPFDNKEAYLEAFKEAEHEAIINISKFIEIMTNNLKNDENNPIKIKVNGLVKDKINKKLKKRFNSHNFKTSSILRGITVTQSCYVPGNVVKLSIEVSSDSITAAIKLKNALKNSL